MRDLFDSYWWLLFPLGFLVFAFWDRWLYHQRQRHRLELLKTYAQQGKEPPADLAREAHPAADPGAPGGPYDPRYGGPGYWGGPWWYGRRAWRRYYRWGPYWAWRSAFVTGAVAFGFWWAAEYADFPGGYGVFHLVAVVMTVVAIGNLIAAVVSTGFRGGR